MNAAEVSSLSASGSIIWPSGVTCLPPARQVAVEPVGQRRQAEDGRRHQVLVDTEDAGAPRTSSAGPRPGAAPGRCATASACSEGSSAEPGSSAKPAAIVARRRAQPKGQWFGAVTCDIISGCHESHPPRRRQGHAPAPADHPHAEADRPDLRPAVPPLPDRSRQEGAGDRRGHPEPELPAAPDRGDLRPRRRPRGQDLVRRRADAARHRRARQVRRRGARRNRGRLQRRRHDAGGPGRRPAPPPRAAGEGHHRADAGREPDGLRAGRDRRRRQRPAVPREAEARGDHLQHDQRGHLRARARDVRPDSRRTPPGRSSAASSRRWSSARETFVAYVYAATGSTSARPRSTCRSTATSWTSASRRRRSKARRTDFAMVSPEARIEDGARVEGPCFIDEGDGREGRRAHRRPTRSSAASARSRRTRASTASIVWANTRVGRDALVRQSILGRHCHVGRNSILDGGIVLGDKSVVTDYSRL